VNRFPVDTDNWVQQVKKVRQLAWIIWSVALSAQLLCQFHRIAGSVVVDRVMADFAITAATVGGVLAMYFYVYAAMQFPSGVLADYLGPRKTLTFGCLAAGFGSIVFGFSASITALYMGRILLSLGVSVIFVSVLKIQTQWFPSRLFGRISSLTMCLGMSGALLGTTPMALMAMSVGWRWSFGLMGLLSFIVCLVCWLVIRNRPQDLGLPSTAEIERREVSSTTSTPAEDMDMMGFGKRVHILLTNKHIWSPFLMGIGSYGTLLVFQGAWGIPYLMQIYAMTRDSAANLILLTMIGFMAGTLITAFASDILQRRRWPSIVCAFAYLCTWITLTLWNDGKPPVTALYPLCFSLGFFTGFVVLIVACIKEIVPPLVSGMAMGLVNMSVFISTAALQMLFGKMLDLGWQGVVFEEARVYPSAAFQSGFVLVCAGAFINLIGALLLKETHCRDIYSEISSVN
jgi:sugar phosphate permease